MGEGFGAFRIHSALEHSSSGFRAYSNTRKGKKKLVPVDLTTTTSYADKGSVLDDPATSPGQKSLMLECEHKIGNNYGERVINVRRLDGGDVRVVDVLRAIHDFLYEPVPKTVSPPANVAERVRIEEAYRKRKENEAKGKGKDRAVNTTNDSDQNTAGPSEAVGDSRKVHFHAIQKDLVKMDFLYGRSHFVGLIQSSTHDYKWVFKLDTSTQA